MHITRYLDILLGDALRRVADDEHHIRPPHGEKTAHDAVTLQPLVHLFAAAHPRRVYEHILVRAHGEFGVDGVAGGARGGTDYDAVVAEQFVDQRALAGVGLADYGDPDDLVLFLGMSDGHRLGDRVKQLAEPLALRSRHRVRLAEPQPAERVGKILLVVVQLVDGEHDRHLRLPEIGSDRLVVEGEPRPPVHHIHYGVRGADGDLHLLADMRPHLVVALELQPAGVYESEHAAAPLAVRLHPVPRHAGLVFDDGYPVADQLVEQRGLADIGASDNSYQRFHNSSPRQRRGAKVAYFRGLCARFVR